jgi:hypothetical protein
MKYLSMLPPNNMAEDIKNRYPDQMYYPPAGSEKTYFVVKALLVHYGLHIVIFYNVFPSIQ